jgi:hypothetical protein
LPRFVCLTWSTYLQEASRHKDDESYTEENAPDDRLDEEREDPHSNQPDAYGLIPTAQPPCRLNLTSIRCERTPTVGALWGGIGNFFLAVRTRTKRHSNLPEILPPISLPVRLTPPGMKKAPSEEGADVQSFRRGRKFFSAAEVSLENSMNGNMLGSNRTPRTL